ncbi:hypothetical protein ACFCP7_28320 [Paenibacillus elgii]
MSRFRSVIISAVLLIMVAFFSTTSANAAAVNGPGGSATLDVMSKGSTLYWSATPKTKWPYHFSGQIVIKGLDNSTYKSIPVSGVGALGSSVGDSVGVSLKKGEYVATLTGSATDLNSHLFVVLPGVSVPINITR